LVIVASQGAWNEGVEINDAPADVRKMAKAKILVTRG
jgi:hypothetical protein